jgi:hypothetical protein
MESFRSRVLCLKRDQQQEVYFARTQPLGTERCSARNRVSLPGTVRCLVRCSFQFLSCYTRNHRRYDTLRYGQTSDSFFFITPTQGVVLEFNSQVAYLKRHNKPLQRLQLAASICGPVFFPVYLS